MNHDLLLLMQCLIILEVLCSLLINDIDIILSLSDRLTKPIDLSMMTTEQTSSILPTTISMDFFHIKNMMELTVANTRLREKQLENEIGKNFFGKFNYL